MRTLIKVSIALAFMASAYIIGKYQSDQRYSIKVKELNDISIEDKKIIGQLKDSMALMGIEMDKFNSIKILDTMSIKQPNLITKKTNFKVEK